MTASCKNWWGTTSRERERASHLFKWPLSPLYSSLIPDQWSPCKNWTLLHCCMWTHTQRIYFWIHSQILGHIEESCSQQCAAKCSVQVKGTCFWLFFFSCFLIFSFWSVNIKSASKQKLNENLVKLGMITEKKALWTFRFLRFIQTVEWRVKCRMDRLLTVKTRKTSHASYGSQS